MNPFATRMGANNWVIPVSALSLVLGFMVMSATITSTNRSTRFASLGIAQQDRVGKGPLDLQEEYANLSSEVSKLRKENGELQKALSTRDSSSQVLNTSLQEAKAYAGLTDIQGPGIVVTLRDSKRQPTGFGLNDNIIHDVDVVKVVNELFAAGAEAIDVNGLRIAATSAIRCAGPVIYCDGVRIASPIAVRAVGDPATLVGGMTLPGGVLDEIKQTDPSMVQIEQVKDMRLAAYAGSTSRKYGKVPEDRK